MAELRSPGGQPVRRILTWGGHDFTAQPPDRAIRDYMLGLLESARPRICLLPTASGDPAEQIARFYGSFGDLDCEPSDLSLFRLGAKPVAIRDHLLGQDMIYVGGGSMANLLAVWEVHEMGGILSLAWQRGILLAGQSAGSMCWFEAGITRSSGRPVAAAGLGLLPGSLCVHYHQEPERRSTYLGAVGRGMPAGHGLDDYAGLLWEGTQPVRALRARRGAGVHSVRAEGVRVVEEEVPSEAIHPEERHELPPDIAEFRRAAMGWQRAGRLG